MSYYKATYFREFQPDNFGDASPFTQMTFSVPFSMQRHEGHLKRWVEDEVRQTGAYGEYLIGVEDRLYYYHAIEPARNVEVKRL